MKTKLVKITIYKLSLLVEEHSTATMEGKRSMVYIDVERLERLGKVGANTSHESWEKLSIFRVPPQVSKLNPNAYSPQLVSIGPFHNGKAHLQPMEEHKYRALCNFLRRSETSVEDYVSSLKLVSDQLMDSYEELDKVWKDENRFVELMLLDGCFLLEVLRAKSKICLGYPPKDPVFSVHGIYTSIYNILPDLLMVENQVPMLVLERLLAVERSIPEEPVRSNGLIDWITLQLTRLANFFKDKDENIFIMLFIIIIF